MSDKKSVKLNRDLGLPSALSLVIGTIIGVGIFIRQATVLKETGSTSMALLAWIIGGVITLTAGLSVAEIASKMPHAGGLYSYMEHIYGRLWGFLSGWMQVIVYGPAMIASLGVYLAILLAEFFHFNQAWQLPLSIIVVLLVGGLNLLANRFGATFAIITVIGKAIPITAIIVFGLFFGDQHAIGQSVQVVQGHVGNFGVAVLGTLYAYDGWILVTNLGEELKNPRKMLPKAIVFGILAVMVVYVLVTLATFKSVNVNVIAAKGDDAIPYLVTSAFGELGGKILSIGIIISIAGAMNGKLMSFPRLMFAMARDHELPFHKQLGYLNMKSQAPTHATLATMGISLFMIIFSNADWLSAKAIFIVYVFYVMIFVGLFLLRKREGVDKSKFTVPFYPLVPLVAIAGAIFVLYNEVITDVEGVLLSLGFVLLGVPVYYWKMRQQKRDGFVREIRNLDDEED